MKRTICVGTATRAEYGLLRWLMHEIREDPELTLQCLVTGAHLSPTHGLTYREIEADGFAIDARVEMLLSSDSALAITKSMGLCVIGVGEALLSLRPDMLVVLGDRYELLPMCSAATVLNVPVVHISGGDITEGAIDNQVRHAVTKLAHLHFPGTKDSAERIVQMGEDPSRVFAVGEPGLDAFVRTKPMPRGDLAASLGLDTFSRWVMFTYHPETLDAGAGTDVARTRDALDALADVPNLQTVMTYPNADAGGLEIGTVLEERHARDPSRYKLVKNLGHDRFVSFLREAWAMVGNSSAGIVEAPLARLPTLNIGGRQRGRIMAPNVVNVDGSAESVRAALLRFADPSFRASLVAGESPYGDGMSSKRIKDVLKTVPLAGLLRKTFHAADRR
jgi:GDP/UDP-N,N'-diacetylbacillosamine 2-epimerase (hydrolysing)